MKQSGIRIGISRRTGLTALDILRILPGYDVSAEVVLLTADQADELMFLWMDITGAMEGDGLGEDELKERYPAGCAWTEAETEWLRKHTSSLRRKLDDTRFVSRAKLLLMTRLQMSEEEAHHYIEQTAMDSGRKSREVAESIIRAYEE